MSDPENTAPAEQPRDDENEATDVEGDALPPAPTPKAEPPEPSPGGADAIPGVGGDGPTSTTPRDLDPALNPATDLPEGATGTEDTDTAATRGDDEVPPEEESPA